MFKKRRFYTLTDIRKQLFFTPLIFIFISAIVSIILVSFILEFKKNNDIKLIIQEERFKNNSILNQYISDVKYNASASFDKEELVLNNAVTRLTGFFKYTNEKIDIKRLKELVLSVEKDSNLNFVVFDKRSYEVLHGIESIDYLKIITNSKLEISNFRLHMLKNIEYIGDENLIYWIDNQKRKIRLSFFKKIENSDWFIGVFSKIDDMKNSVRQSIMKSIVSKSKYPRDRFFWFYDYDHGYVYNYYNKGQKLDAKYILEKDKLNSSNAVLQQYDKDNLIANSDGIYNFTKYNFLISIKNFTLPKKVFQVNNNYNSDLFFSISIIFFILIILITASIFFSKFINKIFHRYNTRLETRNIMYKKWKERYELAIIASNDGLWDIDLKTKHIYFSKKWLDMFGYKDGDINNIDEWFNLIHKDDKPNVRNKFEEHLNGESEHFICEYRIRNKVNKYKWIFVRGKAFDDNHHKRMLMMSMDIEQRKRLTKELQYVDLLVEYGRIVIFKWKYDKSFTIDYISKSISAYGYESNDFENQKIRYFDFVHEDDIEELKEDIKKAIENDDKSFSKVHRVKDKDGKIRWIFNRTIFLKDDFGNVTHLYGYINDITRMKLHQEELTLKIKDEVAKNTEKDRLLVHQSKLAAMGEMLGNIAHQWRQPLNNINLLTHFIRDNFKNFSQEELNEIIKDTKIQIDYMSDTIDDFRNFYQPAKDKVKFNIREAIEQSAKIVDTQFEKSGIVLSISGDDIEIINYQNEFQQVILNILNNASDAAVIRKQGIDFVPKVNVSLKKEDKDFVTIELSNNCGEVTQHVMEKMFEPYFTTKFENQGTGIGLYMVKTIIEKNMRGKITVQNIPEGIFFKISLPIE